LSATSTRGFSAALSRAWTKCRISLDGLFVVTIDGGELEVVRVEGRIDRLIADAVAEDP